MKASAIFSLLLVVNLSAFSQVETVQTGADLSDASKLGSRQGYESLQSHSSGIVTGSQFFSPNWSGGTVITTGNETVSKDYLFLFDKVRQALFMKWKDSSFVLLADKNKIKSFTITTDKVHYFIPASAYDPAKKEGFYEILVSGGSGYTLLKMVKTKFIKADEHDMEKIRMGENYDAFEDDVTYYVSVNNAPPQPITLKEKNIKKVLAGAKNKVDDYFTHNGDASLDESFMINLVQAINS